MDFPTTAERLSTINTPIGAILSTTNQSSRSSRASASERLVYRYDLVKNDLLAMGREAAPTILSVLMVAMGNEALQLNALSLLSEIQRRGENISGICPEVLEPLLKSNNSDIRRLAGELIIAVDPWKAPRIIWEHLENERDETVRAALVARLAASGDYRANQQLTIFPPSTLMEGCVNILQSRRSVFLLRKLEEMADEGQCIHGVQPGILIRIWESTPEPDIRAMALNTLLQHPGIIVTVFLKQAARNEILSDEDREKVEDALVQRGDTDSINRMIDRAFSAHIYWRERVMALRRLANLGEKITEEAYKAIGAALLDADERVRTEAVRAFHIIPCCEAEARILWRMMEEAKFEIDLCNLIYPAIAKSGEMAYRVLRDAIFGQTEFAGKVLAIRSLGINGQESPEMACGILLQTFSLEDERLLNEAVISLSMIMARDDLIMARFHEAMTNASAPLTERQRDGVNRAYLEAQSRLSELLSS